MQSLWEDYNVDLRRNSFLPTYTNNIDQFWIVRYDGAYQRWGTKGHRGAKFELNNGLLNSIPLGLEWYSEGFMSPQVGAWVSTPAPTPEPSEYALLIIGISSLLYVASKRKVHT